MDRARPWAALLLFAWLGTQEARALEVWTEAPVVFRKSGIPTLPANQDRLTDTVWITRGFSRGLYNIAPGQETSFASGVSPIGTRWAFAGLNGNPVAISAADHARLSFSDWETSLGGEGVLRDHIFDRPGVLHLVAADVYVDIRFTEWGSGGSGTFTYTRASAPARAPVPIASPTAGLLLALALVATGVVTAWGRSPLGGPPRGASRSLASNDPTATYASSAAASDAR